MPKISIDLGPTFFPKHETRSGMTPEMAKKVIDEVFVAINRIGFESNLIEVIKIHSDDVPHAKFFTISGKVVFCDPLGFPEENNQSQKGKTFEEVFCTELRGAASISQAIVGCVNKAVNTRLKTLSKPYSKVL